MFKQHNINDLPKGYRFPAEWEPHAATWLSYPHNEASWPGKIETIFTSYNLFIKTIAMGEVVNINVLDEDMRSAVVDALTENGTNMDNIRLHINPTNDAWARDHGPAFMVNPQATDHKKVIINWNSNAWGGKYPYELDTRIPTEIGKILDLPVYYPNIVMEGGSVDFNGRGTLITTTACLLHENRNPFLNQEQIETYLRNYYGVEQILWLGDGIEGDDTNGHVDDITRFVNHNTVVTVVEPNTADPNHEPLAKNLAALKEMRLPDGSPLNIIELPMPQTIEYDGQRLPASYANFYIANHAVIVPTYNCPQDQEALQILAKCFPDRKVVGIDSVELIWGLGSFHCLSQQEPAV